MGKKYANNMKKPSPIYFLASPYLRGQTFGRLLVLGRVREKTHNHIKWRCQCICGGIVEVRSNALTCGGTKSCGCLRREIISKLNPTGKSSNNYKHGGRGTRLYRTWLDMKARCNNPNATRYEYYGEKGITVYDEWVNDFKAFQAWVLTHGYADNLTIDRIDSSGNYEPGNCQFVTKSENSKKANRERYKKENKA